MCSPFLKFISFLIKPINLLTLFYGRYDFSWPVVKTRGGWWRIPSDLMTGAHRETDCQRQTEPWGGCNEYAAPCGGDDLINNNKLSLRPGLLGAALCARANGLKFTRRDWESLQERHLLDVISQDRLLGCRGSLYTPWISHFRPSRHSTLQSTECLFSL